MYYAIILSYIVLNPSYNNRTISGEIRDKEEVCTPLRSYQVQVYT